MIDSHSHLFDDKLLPQISEVINASNDAGFNAIICPSINLLTSNQSISLSNQFPKFIFPAVGIHPTEIVFDQDLKDLDSLYVEIEKLRYVLEHNNNIVGIGECGLDYYWIEKKTLEESKQKIFKTLQHELLAKQLQLAIEFSFPIIIHLRDVNGSFQIYSDFLELMSNIKNPPKLHLHSFSGNEEFINDILKYDAYFSFTSYIRSPNADYIRELLPLIPLDRLVLETDSPYSRSIRNKISNPTDLVENLHYISSLLKIDNAELEDITDRNAIELYELNL